MYDFYIIKNGKTLMIREIMKLLRFSSIFTAYLAVSLGAMAQFTFNPNNEIQVLVNEQPLLHPWAGGLNSAQFQTMDLNGDDLLDLVVFDRTSSKISTFLNNENTNYIYDWDYELYFPDDVNNWMVLVDYDHDGKKDLFTTSQFGMKIYKNVSNNLPMWELVADPLFTKGTSSMVNLQVNNADIPIINDIDGDGDVDILVFNFFASNRIDFHINLSMENFGHSDSLLFERIDRHWGKLEECNCGIYAFDDLCENINVNGIPNNGRTNHIGGKAILALDNDGDGDMDLLFGDETCSSLYYFENQGTKDNAVFTDFIDQYPNTSNPIDFPFFPAGFYEDLNFDGIKDLIVSPNLAENVGNMVNFKNSSYLYLNAGNNDNPQFVYEQNNFIQAQSIDFGENTTPLFLDYDQDGDQDLVVGEYGSGHEDGFYGTLKLLKNIGDRNIANFQLEDEDFLSLSQFKLTNLQAYLADVNGDGLDDLIFCGNRSAPLITKDIFYVINTSPEPKGYVFNIDVNDQFALPLLFNEYPYFIDLNDDALIDILLSKSTGRVEYYRNIGNNEFELENKFFYNITDDILKRTPSIFAIDLNGDNLKELIISDATGKINIYEDFLNNLDSPVIPSESNFFHNLTSANWPGNLGKQSWLGFADLNNDRLPELVTGNKQGGLYFFQNNSTKKSPGGNDDQLSFLIYPNPASGNDLLYVESNQDGKIAIYNQLGQHVSQISNIQAQQTLQIDLQHLAMGIYMIKLVSDTQELAKKFILYK